MDIFNVLTMIGGLCLFLFGMNLMGQALERRAGGKLRRAVGVVCGGVYSRRRSGCFNKTGSAPKPRYHARALPRFRPIQGGIRALVPQLRINSARIFCRPVLRPVLRGVDDGDLGFQK